MAWARCGRPSTPATTAGSPSRSSPTRRYGRTSCGRGSCSRWRWRRRSRTRTWCRSTTSASGLRRTSLRHRDVKPSNILLHDGVDDGVDHVYLTDWGIAQRVDTSDPAITRVGQMVGTPPYIAPERLLGTQADHRADIYSLAVVLYQALSGRLPFGAEGQPFPLKAHLFDPPAPLPPTVPRALRDVVMKGLAKEPDDRQQDAASFGRAAYAALNAEPKTPARARKPIMGDQDEPAPFPSRRRDPGPAGPAVARTMKPLRAVVGTIGAALLLVVAFVVVRNVVTGGDDAGCAGDPRAVRGIVGSEKEAYLRDARVAEIFRCAGYDLRIDARGSREMISSLRPGNDYDFALPSSTPTARTIMTTLKIDKSYRPFSSVMVVATFTETVDVLRANGIARRVNGTDTVSVAKLVELGRKGTRWRDLKGNTGSPNGNVVLMRTTDPADSNSAIMFVSIVSSVLNGDKPVADDGALAKVMPELCRLISYQGQKPSTSEVLFDEYLTDGPNRTPMALIYESQYYDEASSSQVPEDGRHVLLFPNPTVYAWHTLVPITEPGDAVGRMLRDDKELQDIAVRYGFRPEGRSLPDRPAPPVVVEPPEYPLLEKMIDRLGPFDQQNGKCAQ
ncbi:serine/threonine-protein kinase [Actinoplanes sp. NPDC051470]|uniref:serine/threonine-protein kinase n=1 Tax=Actinoplanes sp. NPDC051470 TaxID=3157224 RepID=UPI0034388A0D